MGKGERPPLVRIDKEIRAAIYEPPKSGFEYDEKAKPH